ncbi:MAG: hypothetical protein AB8B69_15215 [Chitinophagales bacterium]
MKYFETLARKLQELYGLPDTAVQSWKQNGAIPSRYKELEVSDLERVTDERVEYFLNHKAVNSNNIIPKYPNTIAQRTERTAWSGREALQAETIRKDMVNTIGQFILNPDYKSLKTFLVEDKRINAQQLLGVMDWTPKEVRKFCDRLEKDALVYQEEVDSCVAAFGIFRSQIE